MGNKVMGPDEIRALPDGTQVWLEMKRKDEQLFTGWHYKRGESLSLSGSSFGFTIGGPGHRGKRFRVWALEPTKQEMKETPW